MSDMYPTPPKTTKYSSAFESCWKVHSIGNKKSAWKAGIKAEFTDSTWAWLENYLIARHKDDAKWIEGKYVPHLSSIINAERWDDRYKRVNRARVQWSDDEFKETPEEAAAKIKMDEARRQRDAEQAAIRRSQLH